MPIADLDGAIARGLPRLMTLCDRAVLSPRRGCADRPYWHYRVDKDYPSATYAQVAWPLALLAAGPAPVPAPALRARLADLALAALSWWADVQHDDGSFDEWFLNERSHVATAFTTVAAVEAATTLGDRFRQWEGKGAVLAAMGRAAGWLAAHGDPAVGNHAAGAVAALAAAKQLVNEAVAPADIERQVAALEKLQDPEGFLPEYGGADPGYATVSLAFLALAARHLPEGRLDGLLDGLLAFVSPFVHPDGSFGGEYGRRGTRYAWLLGPALLARQRPEAAALTAALVDGFSRGGLAPPDAFDDRYFAFFAFPDLVAARAALDGASLAPVPQPREASFPRAGLRVLRSGPLHVVLGTRTGGVVKTYAGSSLLLDDCGYVGRLGGERRIASWSFPMEARELRGAYVSEGPFCAWTRESPIAKHPVAFRMFNRTVGRVPRASEQVSRLAKRRYTQKPRAVPIRWRREATLRDGALALTDRIAVERGSLPDRLCRVAGFAPIHVPSAPLWMPAFEPLLPAEGPDLAPLLRAGKPLDIETRLEVRGGRARLTVRAAGHILQDADVELRT